MAKKSKSKTPAIDLSAIDKVEYGIVAIGGEKADQIFYSALYNSPPTEEDFWKLRQQLFNDSLKGFNPPIFVLVLATKEQLELAKKRIREQNSEPGFVGKKKHKSLDT